MGYWICIGMVGVVMAVLTVAGAARAMPWDGDADGDGQ